MPLRVGSYRSRPRAQHQSRVFCLGSREAIRLMGQPTWTARCCYRRCDWMHCRGCIQPPGQRRWPGPVVCGCRRPRPEVRNLDLYPPSGRSAQSQSRPPPGWKRVGLAAQGLGQGYKSQRGDGVRVSTSLCGRIVCLLEPSG
jgi:hypothetical protein